jgi:hypothetical protein
VGGHDGVSWLDAVGEPPEGPPEGCCCPCWGAPLAWAQALALALALAPVPSGAT